MAWIESFIDCGLKEVSKSIIKEECNRLVHFMSFATTDIHPSNIPDNRKYFVFRCNMWACQSLHNMFRDKIHMEALVSCYRELEASLYFPGKGYDREVDKIMGKIKDDNFFYPSMGFMRIEEDNNLSEEERFISKIKFVTDYNTELKDTHEDMVMIPNGVDSIMVRTKEPLTDTFIEEQLRNLRHKYICYDEARGDITCQHIYHIKGNDLALKDIFKIQVKTTENFAKGLGISRFDPNPILEEIEEGKYRLDDIKEVCFCPAKLSRLSEIYDSDPAERVLFIEIKQENGIQRG